MLFKSTFCSHSEAVRLYAGRWIFPYVASSRETLCLVGTVLICFKNNPFLNCKFARSHSISVCYSQNTRLDLQQSQPWARTRRIYRRRAPHDTFFKKLLYHLKTTLQRRTTTKNTFSNIKILQKGVHFFQASWAVPLLLASLEQKRNTFWNNWTVEYNYITYY